MDRSLIIGGVAIGVLYLVESAGGPVATLGHVRHGVKSGAQGKPLPNISTPGNQAAIASLVALGSVAGVPVTVDPPGLLSTTIGWPSDFSNCAPMTRARRSVPPPGG